MERELEEAKKRHPTNYGRGDPYPVKDKSGQGWKRIAPNVILFQRRAG